MVGKKNPSTFPSPKLILYPDIKANNIMIQFSSRAPEWKIAKVQLVDLEDAHYTPPPAALGGAWVGNIMWRSPEAHAMGPIRKSSDMWSFGLVVCLYLSLYTTSYIYMYTLTTSLSLSSHIVSLRHHPRPPLRGRQGILTKRCRATGRCRGASDILLCRSR